MTIDTRHFEYPLLYFVFFPSKSRSDTIQSAVVREQYGDDGRITVPHGFDKDVANALPSIWYCLHLPATSFDFIDQPLPQMKLSQKLHLDHHIILIPVNAIEADLLPNLMHERTLAGIFCPDEILEDVNQKTSNLSPILPVTPQSTLSQEKLDSQWIALQERIFPDGPSLERRIQLTKRLDLASIDLPHQWLARQMDKDFDSDAELEEFSLDRALILHLMVSSFEKLEREGVETMEQLEKALPGEMDRQHRSLRIPIVVGLPGVPTKYSKRAYTKEIQNRIKPIRRGDTSDTWSTDIGSRSDTLIERAAIELLTTHQAIGRSGIGLSLESVPQEAFVTLAQLERHFTDGPNGIKSWKLLDRLNSATTSLREGPLQAGVFRSSHLTVFSNFPVGLLTLPGDTSPLLCRTPISYRPILPLTRTMQLELQHVAPAILTSGIRILVAECIVPTDPVGQASRRGWSKSQESLIEFGQHVSMEIIETLSIATLRDAVKRNPCDILVLSAHGAADLGVNVAGIVVGSEFCLELDLDGFLPPVVILSACQVSPRGTGTVSVADMLLRDGAMSVLGTQVPVNVFHNAVLMGRFFANLAATFSGQLQYTTVLEVWHHTQTGNAVTDILHSVKALLKWAGSASSLETSIFHEFMMVRSGGRLRTNHVYADSEKVLEEIADDRGIGDKFRTWMRNRRYVPESLFYVFFGWPERVFLRDRAVGMQQQVGEPPLSGG